MDRTSDRAQIDILGEDEPSPGAVREGDQNRGHGHRVSELKRRMQDHTLAEDVTKGDRHHHGLNLDVLERIVAVSPLSSARREEAEAILIDAGANPDPEVVVERTPLVASKKR